MIQYYDEVVPGGQAQYADFYPLGKELILRLYRNQDTSTVSQPHIMDSSPTLFLPLFLPPSPQSTPFLPSLSPSPSLPQSEWIHLQSDGLGQYQLNKYTGEIRRDVATLSPTATHPQMDLVNQAYRQVPIHHTHTLRYLYTLTGSCTLHINLYTHAHTLRYLYTHTGSCTLIQVPVH